MKIESYQDCGNAPKKLIIEKVTIAFARFDAAPVEDHLSEDFCWERIGQKMVFGLYELKDVMKQLSIKKMSKLVVNNILTHGKLAAVHGEYHMDGGDIFGFCDVYTFKSAGSKIVSKITSYVTEIK